MSDNAEQSAGEALVDRLSKWSEQYRTVGNLSERFPASMFSAYDSGVLSGISMGLYLAGQEVHRFLSAEKSKNNKTQGFEN